MVIFFDIDDALLNHISAEQQAAQQLHAHFRHQLPYIEQDFAALWKQVAEQHMAAFLAGTITFPEQLCRRIRAVFPTALEDHEADRLFRIYLAYYEQSWRVFPDVLPCLDRLTAHTLGIVSNGNTTQQK
jgi:putative hydrolase of the HAD superfamily